MQNFIKTSLVKFKNKVTKKQNAQANNNLNKLKFVVHPVTLIFCAMSIFAGMFWLFFTYLVCLLFHEFSHAMLAKRLGYRCTKITLYPTGALLSGNADEFTFKDEIIISLAGPLSNIFLIIICVFLWWIFPEVYNYTGDFVVANLSLALFNLLPIFPLDGGRCLLAMLSLKTQRKNATKICKNVTLIFSILLFLVFIISCFFTFNLQIGIMSIVIFITAISEDKEATYKRLVKSSLKRRKLNHGLAVKTLMFNKKTSISKVLAKIDNFAYYNICVVDDDFNILAKFTEMQLEDKLIKINKASQLKDLI